MNTVTEALRGAGHQTPATTRRRGRAIVVGAGGTLGSAVLEQALACGGFAQVTAVTTAPLASALRGFDTVAPDRLDSPGAETAFIVFERARHANGRDEAFARPQVDDLAAWAARLHGAGLCRLLVLVPHAPALLPHALKVGLASLDEASVAALGFEQLVFVRAAATGTGAGTPALQRGLDRFAAWWLSQLSWMIPQREQPVRAVRLAELVVRLALRLDQASAGTRVLPPEVLWQAAQPDAADRVFEAWLAGRGSDDSDGR